MELATLLTYGNREVRGDEECAASEAGESVFRSGKMAHSIKSSLKARPELYLQFVVYENQEQQHVSVSLALREEWCDTAGQP